MVEGGRPQWLFKTQIDILSLRELEGRNGEGAHRLWSLGASIKRILRMLKNNHNAFSGLEKALMFEVQINLDEKICTYGYFELMSAR